MTNMRDDVLETRLRETFQALAKAPISPGRMPTLSATRRPRVARRVTTVLVAAAIVVVFFVPLPHVSLFHSLVAPAKTTPASTQTVTSAKVTPTAVTGADGYLWMLGTYPCAAGTCPVLMRSTDGGKSFVRVGTPPAGMYGLEFANRRDGYGLLQQTPLGGPSLYQTIDSGKLWRLAPSLGVITSPIVTANGRAFLAAYQDCSKTECRSLDLASSAVTSDSWTMEALPLSRHAINYPDYYEVGLTAFGSKLWVAVTSAIGNTLLFVSNDGGHNLSVLPSDGLGGLRCDLSATSAKVLWGHCITGLFGYFVRSSDEGQNFLTLRPPGEYAANTNDYLAVSNDEALFDVAGAQGTLITRNGGRTFVRLPGAARGVGAGNIVPLSATDWFAQSVSRLWRTSNGGRSWQSVKAPTVKAAAGRTAKPTGVVTGYAFACEGIAPAGRAFHVKISLYYDSKLVASETVKSGSKYRFSVRPGEYQVKGWWGSRGVTVRAGAVVTADFPDYCK
ncbi:MAG: hypothetical protein ABSG36_00690 [Acidimicrobiales bacterium]